MIKFHIYLLLSFSLLQSAARADERDMTPSSLKALGAPNDPKVEIAWNRYYDWKEIGDICQRLADAHPNTVQFSSIGTSVG